MENSDKNTFIEISRNKTEAIIIKWYVKKR